MDLDIETCRRARLAGDARFDGRFFVGVNSTGIYCRPVCPAPPARERNVQYFPSAAAAAETGLRPCLRCRPEASPPTPACNGRSPRVARAAPPGEYVLHLPFRPPRLWAALLDFLRLRAIPHLEEVTDSSAADPDQFRRTLMAIPGIGERTAQEVSLRALGDAAAFPAGNLGLRKALGLTAKDLEIRSQAWRPWRAYAATYLWQVEE